MFLLADDASDVTMGAFGLALISAMVNVITLIVNKRHDDKLSKMKQELDTEKAEGLKCKKSRLRTRARLKKLIAQVEHNNALSIERDKHDKEELEKRLADLKVELDKKKDQTRVHQSLETPRE